MMPTDPMLTLLSTDNLGEILLDKSETNFKKRHWWHRESIVNTNKTTDANTELLDCTAQGVTDTITLASAANFPGQVVIVRARTVTSGGLVVVTNVSGDTIEGADSGGDLTMSSDGKWALLCSDGVSQWELWIDNHL